MKKVLSYPVTFAALCLNTCIIETKIEKSYLGLLDEADFNHIQEMNIQELLQNYEFNDILNKFEKNYKTFPELTAYLLQKRFENIIDQNKTFLIRIVDDLEQATQNTQVVSENDLPEEEIGIEEF